MIKELGKLQKVIEISMEECYFEDADHWDVDPGYELFKILPNTIKSQLTESRESRARQRRVMVAFIVGERLGGMESKEKCFEPGHGGEESDHYLR